MGGPVGECARVRGPDLDDSAGSAAAAGGGAGAASSSSEGSGAAAGGGAGAASSTSAGCGDSDELSSSVTCECVYTVSHAEVSANIPPEDMSSRLRSETRWRSSVRHSRRIFEYCFFCALDSLSNFFRVSIFRKKSFTRSGVSWEYSFDSASLHSDASKR